jgi:hypothetical protein
MLRLIDLREAALHEYPEFGEVSWPVPWYRNASCVLLLVSTLCALAGVVVCVVKIL